MREIGLREAEIVSGGICENMNFDQCFDGFGDRVAEEIESFAGHISDWWDAWCGYNDLGFWLYDMTHC